MNNYVIKTLDFSNYEIRKAVTELTNQVFELNNDVNYLLTVTKTRNGKSLYLGCYFKEELVAVNIFIAHELLINNTNVIAHQSCWSATIKEHRGNGLFIRLIENAKIILKQNGSAFIFGFPNINSKGIFIKKLGFKEILINKINIVVLINSFFSLNIFLRKINKSLIMDTKNSFIPIEAELIELKTKINSSYIKVYSSSNNIIWGKKKYRKMFGKYISYFSVGGIQINKPSFLKTLFKEIIKNENISFIQIVSVSNNSYLNIFRFIKKAPKTEPLIIFDLNIETTNNNFNFFSGIKDVF